MNLPAVILLIYFSAAYSDQFKNLPSKSEGNSSPTPVRCKDGIIHWNGEKYISTNPIKTVECPVGNRVLCLRVETVDDTKPGHVIQYRCSNKDGLDLCSLEKDGSCQDSTPTNITGKTEVCCSSDPEFTKVPSIIPPPTTTTPPAPIRCREGNVYLSGARSDKTKTVDCPLESGVPSLCVRKEEIFTGRNGGELRTIWYYCSSSSQHYCKDKKDGDCFENSETDSGTTTRTHICCSSDPEFNNLPVWLSDRSSFSPSPTLTILAAFLILVI